MTLEELYNTLTATGIPTAYHAWPEKKAPSMPYICNLSTYSNNFYADGKVYYKVNHLQVELYTKYIDREAEAKIEKELQNLSWEKEEEYLSDQKCYKITYDMEV